jgi:hypothetical protein
VAYNTLLTRLVTSVVDPIFVHEDGSVLPMLDAQDADGYRVHVHHFSLVFVQPDGFHVKGRQGPLVMDHTGEVRWYPLESKVQIDVPEMVLAYDLLIPRGWIDARILRAEAHNHVWGVETISGTSYYVVGLSPPETATTVVVQEEAWVTEQIYLNMTLINHQVNISEALTFSIASVEVNLTLEPKNVTYIEIVIDDETVDYTGARALRPSAADRSIGIDGNIVLGASSFSGSLCFPEIMLSFTRDEQVVANRDSVSHNVSVRANVVGQCEYDTQPPPPPAPYPYNPPAAPTPTRAVRPQIPHGTGVDKHL